jgi:DNA-binding HxlR family transcriptional regulator
MRRTRTTSDALSIAETILSAKWSIPVIRVLTEGPARFSGIRTAIPAISANILAARLRHLEKAGIISRTTLPPPADCQVYALTDVGEATRPILQAIGQWALVFQSAAEQPEADDPPGDPSQRSFSPNGRK